MTRALSTVTITGMVLAATLTACLAQSGSNPWAGGTAASPATGDNPFSGEQRDYAPPQPHAGTDPATYAHVPQPGVAPTYAPPSQAPVAIAPSDNYGYSTYAPPAPAYGAPQAGTAYPGAVQGYPGGTYGYPGAGTLAGLGPGFPLNGGYLPGFGYTAPGGLTTPGIYGAPYLGTLAPFANPYATGYPGLTGLGPYGW